MAVMGASTRELQPEVKSAHERRPGDEKELIRPLTSIDVDDPRDVPATGHGYGNRRRKDQVDGPQPHEGGDSHEGSRQR
jgi:hypothetical protein